MNELLYMMLSEIECDSEGRPTQEVIMSARNIADLKLQKDLDEIEERIMSDKTNDNTKS